MTVVGRRRTRIRVRDLGFEEVVAQLRRMDGVFIVVGVMGGDSETYEDGMPITQVAAINEFGTADGRVPPRPFLRTTLDERRGEIGALVERTMERLTNRKLGKPGAAAAKAAEIIGVFVQAAVQKKIVDLREPPNAPSTIAKKGSSNPLIDTGQLRQAITYTVVRGRNANNLRATGRPLV